MENIKIRSAERTPEIDFDFALNKFRVAGESYPENISEFYEQPIGQLRKHLAGLSGATIEMCFEFVYFNSSTARVLLELFELMEASAIAGNHVCVKWVFPEDDEYMQEIGEEFGEDLEKALFVLEPVK